MDHNEFIRSVPGSTKAVVFIHGICGTPRHFDFLIPLVPESWSIHNVLLHGHGGSVEDFSNSNMDQWQAQINEILEQLSKTCDQILIVGHSLGTLLAINAARKYPNIRQLFLLAVPLRICVRPKIMWNCLQLALDFGDHTKPKLAATKRACGISLDKRIWKYLRWIPNFWSLLRLSRSTRAVSAVTPTPTTVLQSKYDELVCLRSLQHLPPHAAKILLTGSGHYFYTEEDTATIQDAFSSLFI